MKKFVILPLILIIFLNSCSVTDNGEDLSAFIFRMNTLNEQYNITSQGFIYSEGNNEVYKFFIANENEILLKFKEDDKGRLTEMNFVADSKFYEDSSSYEFFNNSIYKTWQHRNFARCYHSWYRYYCLQRHIIIQFFKKKI